MTYLTEDTTNVLVAEDDDDDFDLLAEVIRNLPLKIILQRAENGEILMKILHQHIPDILFLDVMMPCKDGMDCLHEIRMNPKFDNLPIIIFSSVKDHKSIEFFYRHGTNLYVLKPDSYQELVAILEKVFSFDWKKMRYYPKFSEFVLNPA